MDQYKFPSSPIANPEAVVRGPNYRFSLLNNNVIRYEWAADGVFEDRASTFVINRNFPKPNFHVVDQEHQLEIITPPFQLTYDKQRFSPNGLFAAVNGKQLKWGIEWRYGVKDKFNLGGTARTLDDIDGRIDMGQGVISRAGYAEIDDTNSMLFDGNGFVTTRRPGDRIDGYLFFYGLDFKAAMKSFYAISGEQPAIPRWCLGNWWSRYHAYEQEEYLELIDKFKDQKIPLSVAVIDMDWHWVSEAFVPHAGWTGYSWNTQLFPNPEKFQKELHDRALRVTLNDHPRDGVHSHEDAYEELAEVLGHDASSKAPILFDPTSPKFMHAFLNVLHRKLEKQGCDFWWIDWQQGSFSRVPGFDPLWLLNHFQYLDTRQNMGSSNAIIFSRYAGPGSHRYPIGFSGDTISSWESLRFQPEFTATASNIGFGWWSHDIGGHIFGSRDDECTVRWVQSGVFSPIMRLHSTQNRWMSKEPWLYRAECEEIIRKFMQLRHRLVPYIYSSSLIQEEFNLPLIQPLYWNFPREVAAYRHPAEYYFGPGLVVAPVLSQRDKRTNLAKTQVWVPPGRYVDIFSGVVYDGEQEVDMFRPLGQVPALAPEGAIIPLDREIVPANGCPNPDSFEVLVIVGSDGFFEIVENSRDDTGTKSRSECLRRIPIKYDHTSGRLSVASAGKSWTFRFISASIEADRIQVKHGSQLAENIEIEIGYTGDVPCTVVKVPKAISSETEIEINLGQTPHLNVWDHTKAISDLILDYQIEFSTKDRIWEIIEAKQPKQTKIARLISLGLDYTLIGPIMELLLADSRN
ncbi:uncharacterized protein PV09_06798 [Verruconis gallopava]|uniref:Uncharacterized protein n=1 Tax=Verruconis gallopava TaxID=253628 RepID=A0A0D1XI58_9PEZI|nr:uncharacterized protein PV09_06798 [Verruconis gallopava]KIW01961.1 hypothetical protein PV09_06798 [Verruconis gallopava]